MNTNMLTITAALAFAIACTPAQRGQALVGVGAGMCGAGKGLSAAEVNTGSVPWDAVLAGVGCWLADWAAAREDRRREAERRANEARARGLELAPAPEVEQLDELDRAAIAAKEAEAMMIAAPCGQNFDVLIRAYERCRELAPEFGQPRE